MADRFGNEHEDDQCCEHCRGLRMLAEEQQNAINRLRDRVESLEAWNRPIGGLR